jgi:NAD(P)-dependent dehydrogenase (short-subunit alcohol dehydrogenase family)
MTIEAFDDIVGINLRGTFLSTRAELAVMVRQGSGSIVNISSAAGLVGVRHSAAYSASKHGVLGLTKSAALDYADDGIRVNAICPGMIATPLTEAGMPPAYHQAILAAHPLHRVGVADEIASAALWLSGPGASFTTGASLTIDGGMTSQ